jgi:hypothetical protein
LLRQLLFEIVFSWFDPNLGFETCGDEECMLVGLVAQLQMPGAY